MKIINSISQNTNNTTMVKCINRRMFVEHVIFRNQLDQNIVRFVECVYQNMIIIVYGKIISYLGLDNVLVKKIINILFLSYSCILFGVSCFHILEHSLFLPIWKLVISIWWNLISMDKLYRLMDGLLSK